MFASLVSRLGGRSGRRRCEIRAGGAVTTARVVADAAALRGGGPRAVAASRRGAVLVFVQLDGEARRRAGRPKQLQQHSGASHR